VGQQSVAVAALAVSISRLLLHFLCTRNTFHGGTSGTFVIRAVSPSCFGKVCAFAFDIVVVVVVADHVPLMTGHSMSPEDSLLLSLLFLFGQFYVASYLENQKEKKKSS